MILVLAADRDDREALVELLESEGYRTRAVASEDDARLAAQKKLPSVLIVADDDSIAIVSARGPTFVARPFAHGALLARVVHALAAETRSRFVADAPLALAS